MSQLSLLDLAFILFESRDTPLHVTSLIELEVPADRPDFARELYSELLQSSTVKPPFNSRVQFSLTQWPSWQQQDDIDLAQHIHLSMLPAPGSREQLLDLVGRIHSQVLDHHRPLWDMWVIDGFEKNKVVLCLKIHHASADGMRMGAMFKASTTETPEQASIPFWEWELPRAREEKQDHQNQLLKQVFGSANLLRKQLSNAMGIFSMGTDMLSRALRGQDPELKLPFTAPKSPLNQRHRKARGLGLGELPMAKLQRISHLTGASFNDTVMTVCDMAINRYLAQHDIKLNQPLVGLMPIDLRHGNQATSTANKFAAGLVEMGCSDAPPAQRLASISQSTKGVKHQAQMVSPGGYFNYSIAVNALDMLAGKLNLGHLMRPATNLILSNVPGPSSERFFFGARINAVYPLSLLAPGQTLNITMYSYEDRLLFGLVSCRTSLPDAHSITDYLGTALDELERDVMHTVTEAISSDVDPELNMSASEREVLLAEATALVEELKRLRVNPLPRSR